MPSAAALSPLDRIDPRRQPYALADAALGALRDDPTDLGAFSQYLRALVALGLAAAARRWLDHVVGRDAGLADFHRQMADALARGPRGLVPWAESRRQFDENVKALASRDSAAADRVVAATAELTRFEHYLGTDGNDQLLDIETCRWRPGLADHRALARQACAAGGGLDVTQPLAFDGVGLGHGLAEFMARSRRTFLSYSAAVCVIEPDPLALAIALHLHDWAGLIADPRLSIYVGPDAETRAVADLDGDPLRPLAGRIVCQRLTERPAGTYLDHVGGVLARRKARRERLVTEVADRHAADDHTAWRARFAEALRPGAADPLRVLGITSRFTTVLQYSMRALLSAAGRSGCRTHMLVEPNDHTAASDMAGVIAGFRPDLIVLLSRLRHEFGDLPASIPCLTWDQDNLACMRTDEAGRRLDRLTFVTGHAAAFGRIHLGWPAAQTMPCAAAAAVDEYHPNAASGDALARHACDISFVSHCAEPAERLLERSLDAWKGYPQLTPILRRVCGVVIEEASQGRNWSAAAIFRLAARTAAETGVSVTPRGLREVYLTAASVSDRAFRHCALDWAARFCERTGRTLRLYGNGWSQHPRFGGYAAGPAGFGAELCAVYRASRINLQIMETGFVHSRTLDGLAAGGFFLARRTSYDTLVSPLRVIAARLIGQAGPAAGPTDAASLRSLLQSDNPDVVAALRSIGDDVNWSLDDTPGWLRTIPDRPDPYALFPDYGSITFSDEESFVERVEHFLQTEAARVATAAAMRRVVTERFSYDARWREFVDFIMESWRRTG